jgi:hypothetical protein
MPWTCPACSLAIKHAEHESAPQKGIVYRCHICRLELVLNPETEKLVLAPIREAT